MSAILQVGVWAKAKRCLEYLVASEKPTNTELNAARSYARDVALRLEMHQDEMRRHLSQNTDAIHAIRLIDEVHQAFRDDHGGATPEELLDIWCRSRVYASDQKIFATPTEKMGMVEIWERWNGENRLRKQFWFLDFDNTFYAFHNLSEERVLQIKQCLLDWLQKRKAGQVY